MAYRGADAGERRGAVFTLSNGLDHPGAVLMSRGRRVVGGTNSVIGITRKEIDRSQLSAPCLSISNKTFAEDYGVNLTKLNCETLRQHYMFKNCSLPVYYGYKEGIVMQVTPFDALKLTFSLILLQLMA